MKIEEFNIPVPWGHVAVKAWGQKENQPVLVIHGIQDNAGSFDPLIPLLPEAFYYLCIDLPGHGRSSHFPPHLPIHSTNYVYVFKLICDYLKRQKYIIIGHSYGATISLLYAQLYPEHIIKLINLDALFFLPIEANDLGILIHAYAKLNHLYTTPKEPMYTYDEILKKIVEYRRFGAISEELGKILLKRSLIKVDENTYKLSTDPRLSYFINPMWNDRYISELFKQQPLLCPTLLILATNSFVAVRLSYFKEVHDVVRSSSLITLETVEGNHDVHMQHPERVSALITDFLLKVNSRM